MRSDYIQAYINSNDVLLKDLQPDNERVFFNLCMMADPVPTKESAEQLNPASGDNNQIKDTPAVSRADGQPASTRTLK